MDRETEQHTGPALPEGFVFPVQRRCSPLDLPLQRCAPPAVLPPAVPAPAVSPPVRDEARSAILHRHARLTKNGRPVFCTPSRDELTGVVALRQGRGTDGKVIYPTREAAEAAARELEALGTRQLRSYRCGRSRSGHFHLTTDSAQPARLPAQPARLPAQPARIPAQRRALPA